MDFQNLLPTRPARARLGRWTEDDQPGTQRLARWNEDFLWQEHDGSEVRLLINGHQIDHDGSAFYSNQYGNTVKASVREAIQVAQKFEITPDMSPVLRVEVWSHAWERAVIEVPPRYPSTHDPKYSPTYRSFLGDVGDNPDRWIYMASDEDLTSIQTRRPVYFQQYREAKTQEEKSAVYREYYEYMSRLRFQGKRHASLLIFSIEQTDWTWTEEGIERAAEQARALFVQLFPPAGIVPNA